MSTEQSMDGAALSTGRVVGRGRYSAVAQSLHWVVAAMVVAQYLLAGSANQLPLGAHKLALLARHKSFGMTVLMLMLLRWVWRATHSPPPLPAGMPQLQRGMARASHMAFYVLLFAMPLSGWMMSSAKSYSVSWFGLFTWPNLVSPNERLFNFFRAAHGLMAALLFVIAIIHVSAALKHHFWDKDNVLKRMLPFVGGH